MNPRWAPLRHAALRTTLPARAYTDPAWFARRDGARVRADVAGRRPRRAARPARRVHPARRRRRERADRARGATDRFARFTTSAAIAARGCASRTDGTLPGQHPVPVSRVDLRPRRPPAGGAADGRGRRLRSIELSAAPGRVRDVGRPHLHQPCRRRPRRWPRSSAICRRDSRRGAMQELRLAHRIEYDVATNWKLVVQNYNECLHCPVIHPLLNRMHHYLGAENVPTDRDLLRRRDGLQGRRRDAEHRRQAPARRFCPASAGASATVVNYFAIYPNFLLTLHPDYMMTITIWPQDCRPDAARRRMAFPSRRDREAGFRVRGRGRVLGSDQSRGLGDLRAVVSRDQLARLPAGAVLRARKAVVGVRSVRAVTRCNHGSTEHGSTELIDFCASCFRASV